MPPKIIYITGFRQHAGKTVTCLGLVSLLGKIMKPEKIGYLKPVGQKISELPGGLSVENDAVIVNEFTNIINMDINISSPVQLASGFTKKFLSSKDPFHDSLNLQDNILSSIRALSRKEIIIAEGTGHPGVGGIVGLSNAKVANLMNAEIIFLSGGGIGKALDMLEVDLTYFLYMKSRVRGIIFNKLNPDKIPSIKQYITEDLLNKRFPSVGGSMKILGFLPQIDSLSNPSMRVILEELDNAEPIGNPLENAWSLPCDTIKIITLDSANFESSRYLTAGSLVIIAGSASNRIKKILDYNKQLIGDGSTLAGIILTCLESQEVNRAIITEIQKSGIPVITVPDDSAHTEGSIIKIFENTKLQAFDNLKYSKIQQLFEQHFDLEKFIDCFNIKI
ncbi:MAG: AAA family ATPase [Spirochaetales bacterium]|nr:AAA family ATPase [Spirochaetales bacterium]